MYYVVPKIVNRPLHNPKLADQTFWIMLIASVPFFTSLFISGVIQGNMWLDPENTFVKTDGYQIMAYRAGYIWWIHCMLIFSSCTMW